MHSSVHCQSSLVWLIKWKQDFFFCQKTEERALYSPHRLAACLIKFGIFWQAVSIRFWRAMHAHTNFYNTKTLSNAIKAFHFISPENSLIGWHIRCNLHTLVVIWRCFTWCLKIFFHYFQCQSPVRLFFFTWNSGRVIIDFLNDSL